MPPAATVNRQGTCSYPPHYAWRDFCGQIWTRPTQALGLLEYTNTRVKPQDGLLAQTHLVLTKMPRSQFEVHFLMIHSMGQAVPQSAERHVHGSANSSSWSASEFWDVGKVQNLGCYHTKKLSHWKVRSYLKYPPAQLPLSVVTVSDEIRKLTAPAQARAQALAPTLRACTNGEEEGRMWTELLVRYPTSPRKLVKSIVTNK